MNRNQSSQLPLLKWCLTGLAGVVPLFPITPRASAAESDMIITSVFSTVNNGYVRKKMADGSFARENYALGVGSYSAGQGRDRSIDDVKFPVIAGVVGEQLSRQNYFLAPDKKSADLLIVVHWGKTIPFDDLNYRNSVGDLGEALRGLSAANQAAPPAGSNPQGLADPGRSAAAGQLESALMMQELQNRLRDRANEQNARLLGYLHEVNSVNDIRRLAGGGYYYDELIGDLEEDRYYVILVAYDFKLATQENKKKVLWATRISIRARGNRFDERLAAMLAGASRYFGQDSGRLIRKQERVTRVDIGETKTIEVVPDSALPPKPDEKK